MKATNKEIQILNKIVSRCIDVEKTIERFGDSYDLFVADYDFRNSVSMSMLQIGELIKNLSEDFRNEYPKVMWREFAGMRDLFAHQYHKMDIETIWNTAKNDVPQFKNYSNDILSERIKTSSEIKLE